jgi:hypothetical protein
LIASLVAVAAVLGPRMSNLSKSRHSNSSVDRKRKKLARHVFGGKNEKADLLGRLLDRTLLIKLRSLRGHANMQVNLVTS